MKTTEFRKLIREEILKELNPSYVNRMDGMVRQDSLRKLKTAVIDILGDLTEEGFEGPDVIEYIIGKIRVASKAYKK